VSERPQGLQPASGGTARMSSVRPGQPRRPLRNCRTTHKGAAKRNNAHARRWRGIATLAGGTDHARQRVRVGGHGQPRCQPCAGLAAKRHAEAALQAAQALRPPRRKRGDADQALGEGLATANRIQAAEPSHPQPDVDPAHHRGQVSRMPAIAAVHGTACAPAIRTAAARPGAACVNMEEVRAVQRDRLDAAARHGTKLVHVLFYGHDGCRPQTLVLNRYDPRKVRKSHGNQKGSVHRFSGALSMTSFMTKNVRV